MGIRDEYKAKFIQQPKSKDGLLEFVVGFYKLSDDSLVAKEKFIFARGSEIVQRPAKSESGNLLLSDGNEAPLVTSAMVRDRAKNDPLAKLLNYLVGQLPAGDVRTAGQAKLIEWVDSVWGHDLGQPYLPDGKQWQFEEVPTLTKEDISRQVWDWFEKWLQRSQIDLSKVVGGVSDSDL